MTTCKLIDWTGVTELYNRSAYDTKKDGSYVFPTHPKRTADKTTSEPNADQKGPTK